MSIWNDKELTAKIIAELPPEKPMKTYEVEIKRTSYIVCTVEGEDVDAAKDAAWRWYEGAGDEAYADLEIVYCEEVQA